MDGCCQHFQCVHACVGEREKLFKELKRGAYFFCTSCHCISLIPISFSTKVQGAIVGTKASIRSDLGMLLSACIQMCAFSSSRTVKPLCMGRACGPSYTHQNFFLPFEAITCHESPACCMGTCKRIVGLVCLYTSTWGCGQALGGLLPCPWCFLIPFLLSVFYVCV